MNLEKRKFMIISGLVWTISNFHQPITPLYFTDLNLPDHIFGTSYACMVFALFLASSIWGSIGDKRYRFI